MIAPVRLATTEEVEKIRESSDLSNATSVWVWPNESKEPDTVVVRSCMEADPMHFGKDSGNQRKALFGWTLFNMLRSNGVREVYFNVDSEGMEDWIAILEKLGAEKTTLKPQYRFKVNL